MGNTTSTKCDIDETEETIDETEETIDETMSMEDSLIQQAKDLVNEGKLIEAMRVMERAYALFPNSALVHRIYADICFDFANSLNDDDSAMKQECMSKAIWSAGRATYLSPDSIEFAHFFIRLLIENSELERAVEEAEKALSILHPIVPARQNWKNNVIDNDPETRIGDLKNSIRDLVDGILGSEQRNLNSLLEDDLEVYNQIEDAIRGFKRYKEEEEQERINIRDPSKEPLADILARMDKFENESNQLADILVRMDKFEEKESKQLADILVRMDKFEKSDNDSLDKKKNDALTILLIAITVLEGFVSTLYLSSPCTVWPYLISLSVPIFIGIVWFAWMVWLKMKNWDAVGDTNPAENANDDVKITRDIEAGIDGGSEKCIRQSLVKPLLETTGRNPRWCFNVRWTWCFNEQNLYYTGVIVVCICALVYIVVIGIAYHVKCDATKL